MVYMNIGSGIGGAIVVNGALYNGQGRGAGEFGHTYVPDLWEPGENRPPDKVELLCSGWAIERRLRETARMPRGSPLDALTGGDSRRIDGPILAQAAQFGDPVVLDGLDRISKMLGLAIANAIAVFHPERFVVGGGFAQVGEPLFDRLRAAVDRSVFAPFRGRYEILPAELGQDVVVVGALLLAPVADTGQ
jgi:glucokinase